MPARAESFPAFADPAFLLPLLGERIRRFAGVHLGAALCGLGVGTGLLFGFGDGEDAMAADALPLVALGVLAGLWVARRSVEIEDRKEKRNALHAVLPGRRHDLAVYQVLEPALVVVAGAAAALAAWWLVWRFGGTETLPAFDAARPDPWADVKLILGLGLWTLAAETFQTAWNEVRSRYWGSVGGKIAFFAVPLVGGLAVGSVAGRLADDGGLGRALFQRLVASPLSLGLAVAVIVVSIPLGYRLFTRRPSYLSC